jgi:hypothetical protein
MKLIDFRDQPSENWNQLKILLIEVGEPGEESTKM